MTDIVARQCSRLSLDLISVGRQSCRCGTRLFGVGAPMCRVLALHGIVNEPVPRCWLQASLPQCSALSPATGDQGPRPDPLMGNAGIALLLEALEERFPKAPAAPRGCRHRDAAVPALFAFEHVRATRSVSSTASSVKSAGLCSCGRGAMVHSPFGLSLLRSATTPRGLRRSAFRSNRRLIATTTLAAFLCASPAHCSTKTTAAGLARLSLSRRSADLLMLVDGESRHRISLCGLIGAVVSRC